MSADNPVALLRAAMRQTIGAHNGPCHPAVCECHILVAALEATNDVAVNEEPPPPVTAWVDRHGDVWCQGADGLMHTPETAPFTLEYVARRFGPLQEFVQPPPSALADERAELICLLHNEGDGGVWEGFDLANSMIVADFVLAAGFHRTHR